MLARILPDLGSPLDSAIYQDSCGFYPFPIPDWSVFRYSHGFYLIPIVPRILPIIGIQANSSFFRYLTDQFFGTRTDSTRSLEFLGFCRLSVFMLILRFSDTRSVSFSVLARILLDPDSPPDSSIYRYSRGFYPFPIPARSVFRYLHGFYLIPIVPRILPFIGLDADSTLFRYLTDQFFGSRTDST